MNNKNNPIAFIDLQAQQKLIRAKVEQKLIAVLDHGNYIDGPEIYELEERLCQYTGAKSCLACASGTDALIIAMLGMGIGKNDCVFIPSFTFIATANAVLFVGAIPVFVDCDKESCLMDSEDLEKKIKQVKQKGEFNPALIIAVDLYAIPADYPKLLKVSDAYNIPLLADAAQSMGGEQNGKKVGAIVDITATSFFPGKALGAYGDAGAVFSKNNDNDIYSVWKSIRWHGTDEQKQLGIRKGYNGRISSFQAAVLLAKLDIFPQELQKRKYVANRYYENLPKSIKNIKIHDNTLSGYGYFTIITPKRDELESFLKSKNIPCAVYYRTPLHLMPNFAQYNKSDLPNSDLPNSDLPNSDLPNSDLPNSDLPNSDLPNSDFLAKHVLSLPMHPYLFDKQIDYICQMINSFFNENV